MYSEGESAASGASRQQRSRRRPPARSSWTKQPAAAAAQPEGKGTLLIFGNSLSNAVKTMLIHHYDRIVYVDLRHYNTSRGMGKPFSMHELLEEYPVDQILLLGDVNLFMDGELMNP